MTTFSPCGPGTVETRRSSDFCPTLMATRPSCGSRRSAMSIRDITLMREMTGPCTHLRRLERVAQQAVDAVAHDEIRLARLDVDVGGAGLHGLRDDQVDHADDRRRLRTPLVVGDIAFARSASCINSSGRSPAMSLTSVSMVSPFSFE